MNSEIIKRNKTTNISHKELPTIIESTDDKLIVELPYELFISHTDNSSLINDKQIDITSVKPWTVFHK